MYCYFNVINYFYVIMLYLFILSNLELSSYLLK